MEQKKYTFKVCFFSKCTYFPNIPWLDFSSEDIDIDQASKIYLGTIFEKISFSS